MPKTFDYLKPGVPSSKCQANKLNKITRYIANCKTMYILILRKLAKAILILHLKTAKKIPNSFLLMGSNY